MHQSTTPYTEASNPFTDDIDVSDPIGIVNKLSCCDFEMFNPKLASDEQVCYMYSHL